MDSTILRVYRGTESVGLRVDARNDTWTKVGNFVWLLQESVLSPCPAGLDPASHLVKSSRDAPLARLYRQDSVRLRVDARNDMVIY